MTFEQINNSTGTVTYLHHDQQGSIRLLTGSTVTVTVKCTYIAYGAATCEGTTTTPLGYDGQYTSTDTGLIYLRNRVYDPATAQFLTVDPLVALTGEPYSYAADSPLSYEDPSGGISVSTIVTVVVAGGANIGCGLTVEVPGVDALTCDGAADVDSAAAADLAGDEAASVVADDTGTIDGEGGGDDGDSCEEEAGCTLRHYTTNEGAEGIGALGQLRPSEDGFA
jgi:RHS repeat-associated protein